MKVLVEDICAACGAAELRQHPVLSEGGWFEVVCSIEPERLAPAPP